MLATDLWVFVVVFVMGLLLAYVDVLQMSSLTMGVYLIWLRQPLVPY